LIALVFVAVVPALSLILFTVSEERRAAAAEVQDDALRIARLASSAQERLIEAARSHFDGRIDGWYLCSS
jgi:hypothetical protein